MNTLSKQRTLAMITGFERYTKKTRRAMFLEEMEQVVPWAKLCALMKPHYPKPGNGRTTAFNIGHAVTSSLQGACSHPCYCLASMFRNTFKRCPLLRTSSPLKPKTEDSHS